LYPNSTDVRITIAIQEERKTLVKKRGEVPSQKGGKTVREKKVRKDKKGTILGTPIFLPQRRERFLV